MFSQVQRHLQHDAIFYDDETTFSTAAVSFVREGVERGEVADTTADCGPFAECRECRRRDQRL